MDAEVYASLKIFGTDLDPEEVTAKVGVNPTKTWLKDELIHPKAIIRHKQNGWMLRSCLKESTDVEEHVKSVLEQLQIGWRSLTEICSRYDAEISCVIYTSGDRPAIHFDREILKQVSQLNAEIDVDLYVLPASEESAQSASYSG